MSIFKKFLKKDKKQEPQFYQLEVKKVLRETQLAVSLVFEKPEAFDFIPGQYLSLKTNIDGNELRRAYSLSSQPHENELRVTVKETKDGYFSKFVNNEVKAGDYFDVMPPTGNFTFVSDENSERHIAAFAGGSGITPIFSILVNLLENEPNSKFTLVYGNRTEEDIIFKDKLNELAIAYEDRFSIVHILSDVEQHELSEFIGFIDNPILATLNEKYFNFSAVDCFYLCGPGEMIQIVESGLLNQGINASKVKKELFTAPISGAEKATPSTSIASAEIEFIYNGKKQSFNYNDSTKTVLDVALDNGIKAPFSCLNGVCSTCSAKLEEGSVDMEQNFALEPEDVAEGYVLTCQSKPTSTKLVINWDDSKA